MNSDATTLNNAIAILRRYYGTRLDGPRERTEAQMRHTLRERMGVDEATAGRILQQLTLSGQLVYAAAAPGSPIPVISATGPVISIPSTATAGGGMPLITTVSPDLLLDSADEGGSDLGNLAAEVAPDESQAEVGVEDAATGGYWRIGES